MESQQRVDAAGILQLTGVAAVFAAIAVYVTSLSALGLLPAIVIGVTAAATGVLVQYWDWERLGGRRTVIMTNRWIRTGTIPSDIRQEIWRPLLGQREAQALRRWSFPILAAVQIPVALFHLFSARSTTDGVLWICALTFWAGAGVWTLYSNLRWLPAIRRLLRQERTPEALPASEDRGVYSS